MDSSVIRCFFPDDARRSWADFKSSAPRNPEELASCSEVILGHFTSSTFFESIDRDGLVPDIKKERAVEDDLPSDLTSVYLAATFDRFYLKRAVKNHGGAGLIVVVRVDIRSLLADDASLKPADLGLSSKQQLYLSLQFGSCKHRGPIERSRVIGFYDECGQNWNKRITSS